jgi:metal-responsive CopG/Arc/MetJ family transcriptional regulator
MKNVQISFDETLLEEVDRFASTNRVSRSEVVREALRNWMKGQEIKEFEEQWISCLKQSPEDADTAEAWVKVQSWSGR